jgi:hypothetical protein
MPSSAAASVPERAFGASDSEAVPSRDAPCRAFGLHFGLHSRLAAGIVRAPSANVLDHLDELVDGVALPASELDQLPHLLHDRSTLGSSRNRDSATRPKLEQTLVLEQPQRAQDGVPIYTENGREVSRRREPLTGFGLTVSDRTTYLGSDLQIDVGAILFVHLDTNQCTNHTSPLVNRWLA